MLTPVILPDVAVLEQQLLRLVWRGGKIDHPSSEHDDHSAAVAGPIELLASGVAAPVMLQDSWERAARGLNASDPSPWSAGQSRAGEVTDAYDFLFAKHRGPFSA